MRTEAFLQVLIALHILIFMIIGKKAFFNKGNLQFLTSTIYFFSSQEPERTIVSLRGHDFTGLGFNICGNMRDGILVKDVLHRGPASESGLIKAGKKRYIFFLTEAYNIKHDFSLWIIYLSTHR